MTQTLETSRRCPQCGQRRPLDWFVSDGRRARCTPCRARATQQHAARRERVGPMLARADHLWSKYRMRPADYEALRSEQEYRCAICGDHEDEIAFVLGGRPRKDGKPSAEGKKLVIDHCHTTGRVRGLLCNACNTLLGKASERPEVLIAAAAYLKREPTFTPSVQPLLDLDGSTIQQHTG